MIRRLGKQMQGRVIIPGIYAFNSAGKTISLFFRVSGIGKPGLKKDAA